MENKNDKQSKTELKSNPIDEWFAQALVPINRCEPKAPVPEEFNVPEPEAPEPEEFNVPESEQPECIPLSKIKEGFIRWAKSMDTKNDIKSLMMSLTAILDTKSWTDNQNKVLYAALDEFETSRHDCVPKEAIHHKHVDKEVNIYGTLENYY